MRDMPSIGSPTAQRISRRDKLQKHYQYRDSKIQYGDSKVKNSALASRQSQQAAEAPGRDQRQAIAGNMRQT